MTTSITPEARERLVDLLKDRNEIRLDVKNKGCGGKSFAFDFGSAIPTDTIIDIGAERHLAISADCPRELAIDWDDNIFEPHFTFESPAILARCGCGNSVTFA